MAVCNEIFSSSLRKGKNMLAEHYQLERINSEKILSKISSQPINDLFRESTIAISSKSLSNNYKVYDLSDSIGNFLFGGQIPDETDIKSSKKVANQYDFIISRLRYYLKEMAIIPKSEYKVAISTEYLVFKEKSSIPTTILLPFSLSSFVQSILKWAQTGNEHPKFSSQTFKQIPFPDFLLTESTAIDQIVRKSLKNYSTSQSLYTQAQQLLEQELGLDKLAFEKPVGYEANFSDIMDSSRTDAEHFFPAFDKLLSNLPSHISFSPLFKELTYCQRGKQPQYCDKGLKVINSKHVLENKISFENNRYAAPALIKSLEIKSGDVLINGTGRGTIGRSAPYLEDTNAIPDNHVTILRTETFDPVFLSVFLNSKAGKLQVEKYQRGSSGQLELYPFDIKKFLVWEAPDSVQKDIRQLYDKAYAAEKESHHLLENAKTRVEQLIEQAAEKS